MAKSLDHVSDTSNDDRIDETMFEDDASRLGKVQYILSTTITECPISNTVQQSRIRNEVWEQVQYC